jgi:hypothetical protein
VSETLHGWDLPDDAVDDAVLLASELVTNAVLHARCAPSIELLRVDASVRCVVTDASRAEPRRRHYGAEAVTGRGLALVDAIAARWGSDPEPLGKRVWFELDVPARGEPVVRD